MKLDYRDLPDTPRTKLFSHGADGKQQNIGIVFALYTAFWWNLSILWPRNMLRVMGHTCSLKSADHASSASSAPRERVNSSFSSPQSATGQRTGELHLLLPAVCNRSENGWTPASPPRSLQQIRERVKSSFSSPQSATDQRTGELQLLLPTVCNRSENGWTPASPPRSLQQIRERVNSSFSSPQSTADSENGYISHAYKQRRSRKIALQNSQSSDWGNIASCQTDASNIDFYHLPGECYGLHNMLVY